MSIQLFVSNQFSHLEFFISIQKNDGVLLIYNHVTKHYSATSTSIQKVKG